MKKAAIIISPNYKDYAKKYLDDCLESLRKQDYQGEMKIFITDNESSDESFFYLKNKFGFYFGNQEPAEAGWNLKLIKWEIVRNDNNDGFAKGNNDAMRLAIQEGFDYIILFNMDTVIERNCVSEMVKAAESENNPPIPPCEGERQIGAVQARMMLWPEKEKVNSLGNAAHFLGFGYCIGYRSHYDDSVKLQKGSTAPAAIDSDSENKQLLSENNISGCYNGRRLWSQRKYGMRIKNYELRIKDIFYPSGAAVLFKREVLEILSPLHPPCEGGQYFDEEFWMYNEDQDLGWRVWLAGFRCVLAPEAVVYHKYQFTKSIKQFYWMDRNRIIVMIKNYRLGTLVLIFPAFVIMELGLILFSLKTGWFREKMKVWRYFFTPAKWKYLYNARKQVQSLRKVKDRDIIDMISGRIWYQEIDDVKLRLINPVFEFYWKLVKLIIRW